MEILKLFPVPVLKTKIPLRYSKITSILDNQPLISDKELHKSYGERSENTYILDLPELSELKRYILDLIENFSESNLNYHPNLSYKITQSWVTIKNPGESHIIHHHPNSIISGVFYYGEFTENTSNIFFANPDIPSRNPSISHPYEADIVGEIVNKEHIFTPPGTLILFPSWLRHGVPENITSIPRKSLAFNSVPKDKLGDPRSLTELRFNDLE